MKSRIHNFERQRDRHVEFSLNLSYDAPADKLARVPTMLRQAIEAQSATRFDRAHFKGYGESGLTFEVAYFVETADYQRYMDIQQAINLAICRRFDQEGVSFARATPALLVSERTLEGRHAPAAAAPSRH